MDQDQLTRWTRDVQSRWGHTTRQVLWTVGIGVAMLVLIFIVLIGYALPWTGFGQSKVAQDVQPAKTLWDWLDLLIVPIVLAIGGYLFTRSESRATQATAEQRAQDEALQGYLDQMSAMLLPDKDQPSLYKAHPGDSLSSVARARTLTVLPRLAGDRKARVVQFLYEADLIAKGRPIVDLAGADLRGANLRGADLFKAYLFEANLRGANLFKAYLRLANLSKATLSKVTLREADVRGANLFKANLSGATLSEANLSGANLSKATLSKANLREADLSRANVGGADLRGADLFKTYSFEGYPFKDDPFKDDPFEDDPFEDDLRGATRIPNEQLEHLRRTTRITKKQLEQQVNEHLEKQAKSLKGATMPNGQTYEDWLKDREKRQQDE